MKHRLVSHSLRVPALFLALAPAALASSTWYVDGVHGSDHNNCKSRQHACKTIAHALTIASSGDTIMVEAAIYTENLTIGFSLRLVGSGAVTTIIDGEAKGTVVTISNANARVALSKVTIRNGLTKDGGGINNFGTLTVNNSIVSRNIASDPAARGGGIFNTGTLTIANSTVSANTVWGDIAFGGAIFNGGLLTINDTTISGNNAYGGLFFGIADGGGIHNDSGTLTINNSTLSGNSARHGGASITVPPRLFRTPSSRTAQKGETAAAVL